MDFDLVIVGAGLVGRSLAASLAASGLRLALVDSEAAPEQSKSEWDSRIYAISPGSRDFLAGCGAWQQIPAERIMAVDAMRIRGDAASAELVFNAHDAGLPELCFIVENRAIERALRATLDSAPEVTIIPGGSGLEQLEFDERAATLRLADGRRIEARLIVGADGVQSWVRRETGIESSERDYRQLGVVANFEAQSPHYATAHQWFRRDGVLALLPLPGNRVSMVWSTWNEAAERLMALTPEELAREVETATEHVVGALELMGKPLAFPLRLLRVAELIRARVALIGDAAHSVHPLAGQGVNLGFSDARALASVLLERGAQDDCGDRRLLRRYERSRKEKIAAMQLVTDSLQRLFNTRAPGLGWLRNTGLKLTERSAPLKQLLIEHALG